MSAVTIKIKRRASSGSSGSPDALKSGELAFNENTSDKQLYYGYGDDGSGNATSIDAIAGTVFVRGQVSVDASTGVAYNSGTGQFSLGSIPNASLANSAITLNGSPVSLGGSATIDSTLNVSDGSVSSTVPGGGTLTIQGTTNEITVDNSSNTLTVGLPDDVTVAGDLTVSGNMTVDGVVTTVNSTTVTVDDKNIELGSVTTPTDSTADGGGITLLGATSKTISWINSTGSWTFNQPINITSGGLKIGGTEVINSSLALINVTIDGGTF